MRVLINDVEYVPKVDPDGSVPFHTLLRQTRKDQGYTMAEISRITGYSSPYIYLLEQGERSPSFKVVILLSRAYGIPLETLAASYLPIEVNHVHTD